MRRLVVLLVMVLAASLSGCGEVAVESLGVPRLHVIASGIAFDRERVAIPAGQAFIIELDNRDPGVPHGLLFSTRTSGVPPRDLVESEIVAGPGRVLLDVPGLAAGPYLLTCPVHPNMQVEIDAS
jgi:uncharacterized protein YceK